jgi:hypothetical protein
MKPLKFGRQMRLQNELRLLDFRTIGRQITKMTMGDIHAGGFLILAKKWSEIGLFFAEPEIGCN